MRSIEFKFSLVIFAFLVNTLAYSKSTLPKKGFINNWVISPKYEGEYPNKNKYHLQHFQRAMSIRGQKFPISSITVIQQEKIKGDRFPHKEIIEGLKIGFGIEKWKKVHTKNGMYYEANWDHHARILRVHLSETKTHSLVSFANFRMLYKSFSNVETLIIQEKLASLLRKRKVTSFNILDAFSGPAYASDISSDDIEGFLDDLSDEIGDNVNVNGSINVEQVDITGNVNVAEELAEAVENQGQNLNDNISEGIDVVDENAKNLAKVFDEKATNFTEVVDKHGTSATDVLKKVTTPGYIGSAVAEAVLSASLVNLTIKGLTLGITKGVEALWEKITKAKDKKQRWELFKQAIVSWDETLKDALDLERAMASFIEYSEMIKEVKKDNPDLSLEDVIDHFSFELNKENKKLSKIDEKFQDAEGECSDHYNRQLVEQEKIVKRVSDILKSLEDHKAANPDTNVFSEKYFCDQMKMVMNNLLKAENALQKYRIHLLNGQAELAENMVKEMKEQSGLFETYNKETGGRRQERLIDAAKEILELEIQLLEEEKKDKCQGQSSTCFSKYDQKIDEKKKQNELRVARIIEGEQASSKLSYNIDDTIKEMESYEDWFQNLRNQQECFNRGPESEVCKELGKGTHYNGILYAKFQADEKLKKMCPPPISMKAVEDSNPELKKADEEKGLKGFVPRSAQAEASPPNPPTKKKKGFLGSLVDGVKNAFKGFGRMLGFGTSQPVGEVKEATRTRRALHKSPSSRSRRVSNTPRQQSIASRLKVGPKGPRHRLSKKKQQTEERDLNDFLAKHFNLAPTKKASKKKRESASVTSFDKLTLLKIDEIEAISIDEDGLLEFDMEKAEERGYDQELRDLIDEYNEDPDNLDELNFLLDRLLIKEGWKESF